MYIEKKGSTKGLKRNRKNKIRKKSPHNQTKNKNLIARNSMNKRN